MAKKRSMEDLELNYSDDDKGQFMNPNSVAKKKKTDEIDSDEDSPFVSPEKTIDVEKMECEFKTPEKISSKKWGSKTETTPVKERTLSQGSGSPSGWSLASDLSLYIDGDEDDLMSKVEQARRYISSASSSPEKGSQTPKKGSLMSPSGKLGLSPRTPNKGRRVQFITLESPKSKNKD